MAHDCQGDCCHSPARNHYTCRSPAWWFLYFALSFYPLFFNNRYIFSYNSLFYITGGVGSPFIFLYFLSIIASSVILFRQGSLITASLSCLLFSALAIFQYNDILLLPIPTILLDISTISLSLNALFFKVFLY